MASSTRTIVDLPGSARQLVSLSAAADSRGPRATTRAAPGPRARLNSRAGRSSSRRLLLLGYSCNNANTYNDEDTPVVPVAHDPDLHALSEVIEHAGHLLPAQGPITVFIHHNTLHAFEDLPFNEAVMKAAHLFGCQPYLTEDRYRQELRRGRIRFTDLKETLENDLGERAGGRIPCFGTRLDLRLAMLQNPLRSGPTPELVWYVAEANAPEAHS